MTIEEMLRGESKTVEFKKELPKDGHKYMKTVVAFANGRGGCILFGVEDGTGRVLGVDSVDEEDGHGHEHEQNPFRMMDAIANAISDNCEPTIIPDISLKTVDGKTIIIVDIEAGRQKPYYLKSKGLDRGTYIRVGGTTRQADRELIRELYYESEGRSYDCVARDDLAVSDSDIERMCEAMTEVALSNCDSPIQKREIRPVTKNQLISWGVLAEKESKVLPTNAYVFLQGLDSFHSRIQCGVFKGTGREVFVDKRDYEGPLWQQVEDAFQFVLRNIRLGASIEGLFRKETYEIPPESIRELIVNAAVHCSFLQSSNIQVAVYDDRLEVSSPGGLMPGVTIEKMKEGFSKIRNHAIANAFAYMRLIERWGGGIPKVIREVAAYGLREPEFIDMDGALRVNIYRSMGKAGTKIDDTSIETNTETDTERKIRLMVRQDPAITIDEMAGKSGLSRSGVRYALNKMREKGVLERRGAQKNGVWVIRAGE